jgi:hypothetical protein
LIGCKLVHFDAALAISLLFALFITHQAYILHLMEKNFPLIITRRAPLKYSS